MVDITQNSDDVAQALIGGLRWQTIADGQDEVYQMRALMERKRWSGFACGVGGQPVQRDAGGGGEGFEGEEVVVKEGAEDLLDFGSGEGFLHGIVLSLKGEGWRKFILEWFLGVVN